MENETEKVTVLQFGEEGSRRIEDTVVRESPLTIILNNREIVTLLCSPADLEYLAIGFLFSEGQLGSKAEIKKTSVDKQRGIVRVETGSEGTPGEPVLKRFITSGGGSSSAADVRNQPVIASKTQISTGSVISMVNDFQHRSRIFRATGGVHSAALCDTENILLFKEDIGRHNAIDKIFGECLLRDIQTEDRIVITSGRISSEILLKVAKRNIPILISKSAPTDLGVKLAAELGITLLGFVRGKRINAYANEWRIVSGG